MKKLFIVGSHPSTKKQIEQLINCITSLKPLGWDILLVTHHPVSLEIQSMVDYFIYDKNNIMVPSDISPHIFSSNHIFDFKIYLGGHALAISTHISNSFTFAKNYGYDFCYYLESDSSFDISDLHKLDQLSIQMESENKDMVIFNPESFIVKDCYYGEDGQFFYETLLFGAKINQFLDVFNPPKTIDEWLNNDMCYNLESCLYHKYKDRKDKCLIVPTFVHETLTESQINTNRFGMFVCEIIKNEKDKNLPILLINNLNGSTNTKVVKIYLDGTLVNTVTSYPGTWFYQPLNFDGQELFYEIFENDEFEESKSIILNQEYLNTINNKLSYISFH